MNIASPHSLARIAGVFYLLNIVTSLIAFSGKGSHSLLVTSGLVATLSYAAVTVSFYYLFKPVSRNLSLAAALFSLAGCANGILNSFHLLPFRIHSLVFFGFYCLLIGYLILASAFLPHILGMLMLVAGAGWLTFISRPLAAYLTPWHYIAGGVGEGLLTIWLLVFGCANDGSMPTFVGQGFSLRRASARQHSSSSPLGKGIRVHGFSDVHLLLTPKIQPSIARHARAAPRTIHDRSKVLNH